MDKQKVAATEEDKEKWAGMIEMLTPIRQVYCTEGWDCLSNDLAVHDIRRLWHCREYPVENCEDRRSTPSMKGQTDPGSDLLVRKARMKKRVVF